MSKDSQTMREAALAPNIMRAALMYAQLGYSVIPVQGKQCTIDWQRNQTYPATQAKILRWYGDGMLTGVALVCGAVSRNLVILDFDGLDCAKEFREIFPELCKTHHVLSGSRNGEHYYYHVDQLPQTTRTKGFELRADGHYVVAPPSLHASGFQYSVYGDYPIMHLPNIANVAAWINAKKTMKGFIPRDVEPVVRFSDTPLLTQDDPFTFNPRNPGRQMERPQYMRLCWLASAVQSELNWLRSRPEGLRNDALFRASIVLSQLVAGGEIDGERTYSHLLDAALAIGLSQDEANATIKSGFERGFNEPRRVPQTPKRA